MKKIVVLFTLVSCSTPGSRQEQTPGGSQGTSTDQSMIEVVGSPQDGYQVTGYHQDSTVYFSFTDSPGDTVAMKAQAQQAINQLSKDQ